MKSIKFNDEMIRAILAGRKTQTRRPMKPQPEQIHQSLKDSEILCFKDGYGPRSCYPYSWNQSPWVWVYEFKRVEVGQ